MSRRDFLLRTGVTAATLGIAAGTGWRLRDVRSPAPWDERAFAPPGDARVAVMRASSYGGDLEDLIASGLQEVGADVRGARVLLKPNLVEYDPGAAINTDPRLVAAAVLAFRRLGAATVTVGEAPGHRRDTGYVVEASGLGDLLREVRAPFINLDTDAVSARRLHSRYTTFGELWLPRTVVDADVIVSMPKMKTHHWAGVTLSLKNCFGFLPGRVYGWPKNALHWAGIEASILDVAGAIRPDLAIVDGIVGMEGNGPIDGTPVGAGLVVIGNDPVATDVIAASVMGVDPERVAYLTEAGRFLGQADRERILDVGEDPGRATHAFHSAPGFEHLSE